MGYASGLVGDASAVVMPAVRLVVKLGADGQTPAAHMLVKSIVRKAGDQPDVCIIEAQGKRWSQFEEIPPDEMVQVDLVTQGASFPMFVGRISGRGASYDENGETVTYHALGPRRELQRDYVLGQEVPTFAPSEDEVPTAPVLRCVTALPAVFNPGARGNRSLDSFTDDEGATGEGFDPDPRLAADADRDWPLSVALTDVYDQRLRTRRHELRDIGDAAAANLVGHPLGEGRTFEQAVLKDRVVGGVDVDGENLLTAIHRLIEAGSLRWWVRPVGLTDEGPVGEPRITPKSATEGQPVVHRLFLPAVDQGALPDTSVALPSLAALDRAPNHNRGELREDWSRVYSEVVCAGAPLTFEAEFTLVPGWRTADEADLTGGTGSDGVEDIRIGCAEASSSQWNPDAADLAAPYHRDVGRLFILDESGDEAGRGRDPFDWLLDDDSAPLGMTEPIAIRPRPFLPELQQRPRLAEGDKRGRRVTPVKLEVWHPTAGEWRPVSASWELDRERAGVRITDERLGPPFLDEDAQTFATKIRMTLAVETDHRMIASSSTAVSSAGGRMLIRGDREYQPVGSDASIAEARLGELASAKLSANSFPVRSAGFSIPWFAPGYEPGHWIGGIEGRDITVAGQIVEVRFDMDAQDTHLTLDDATVFIGDTP